MKASLGFNGQVGITFDIDAVLAVAEYATRTC